MSCTTMLLHFLATATASAVTIAGIFPASDKTAAPLFIDSIKSANQLTVMSKPEGFQLLEGLFLTFDDSNGESIRKAVCAAASRQAYAIVGPMNAIGSPILEHLAAKSGILYIGVGCSQRPWLRGKLSLAMTPCFSDVMYAVKDLVSIWNWSNLLLVYRFDDDILDLEPLLTAYELRRTNIKTVQADDDFTEALTAIRSSTFDRIVLRLPTADVMPFLDKDMLEMDLRRFKYNNGLITGFQIIPKTSLYEVVLDRARRRYKGQGHFPATYAASLRDVVMAFSLALQEISFPDTSDSHFDCKTWSSSKPGSWDTGLLGPYKLDKHGARRTESLGVYQLTYGGNPSLISYWYDDRGIVDSMHKSRGWYSGDGYAASRPHLHEPPYVMRSDTETVAKENIQFRGFCVDLLNQLSQDLQFTYTIQLAKDGKYGTALGENPSSWDGMIGEILRNEADLAVAPLTGSYKRSQVVDFTQPFLPVGISILLKYPEPRQPNMMSFLYPLSARVWCSIIATIVTVMILLYIVARVSPYEWFVPPRCANAPRGRQRRGRVFKVNNYTIQNTIWFVASTLLKGGCDFGPKATSTRVIGGCWWTFTMVLVSAYTANLAAVLTVDRRWLPIRSLDDLGDQTEIQYGTMRGGSTAQFFAESMIPSHQKIWKYMEQHPELHVDSNEEGVERVIQGKYAYIMEWPSLEYAVNTNCNLTQVGGVLALNHYSIAAPKGSDWTEKMSQKILEYRERDVIGQLKKRWWERMPKPCSMVKAATMKEGRIPMGMANIGGKFIILLLGLCLALLVAIVEYRTSAKELPYTHLAVPKTGTKADTRFALINRSSRSPHVYRKCSSRRVSFGVKKSSSIESKI